MPKYTMTLVSRNAKTGPMPVVTASRDTCPDTCALKDGGGCYAENAPLRFHWDKTTDTGMSFGQLVDAIRRLPRGQVWRYGQAGDLPPSADEILALAKASRGRPAIVYTHGRDYDTYHKASEYGFHINLSADALKDCDELARTNLSVVTVLPSSMERGKDEQLSEFKNRIGALHTEQGRRVAICPATYTETNCLLCQACSKKRPGETIIGFPAHGAKKKTVDHRAEEGLKQEAILTRAA